MMKYINSRISFGAYLIEQNSFPASTKAGQYNGIRLCTFEQANYNTNH